MKLVKQSAKFLDLVCNDTSNKAIIEAGAICYKTENPSGNFIQKRINSGHTSILEHGNIIMMVNDKMLSFMRAFVMHSTELNYIRFTIRHENFNVISGNCRAWYNLLLKNTQADKKKGYSSFLCLLATRLKNKFPEIFGQLFKDKRFPTLQNMDGFVLKFLNIDELIRPEFITHVRLMAYVVSERIISQQWFRHRNLSPSQESTRYCNYAKDKFNNEITFIESSKYFKNQEDFVLNMTAYEHQEKAYFSLIESGNKPEIARSVLGNGLKSEYFVSGYINDWEDFFHQRLNNDADPQIKDLANELFHQFAEIVG